MPYIYKHSTILVYWNIILAFFWWKTQSRRTGFMTAIPFFIGTHFRIEYGVLKHSNFRRRINPMCLLYDPWLGCWQILQKISVSSLKNSICSSRKFTRAQNWLHRTTYVDCRSLKSLKIQIFKHSNYRVKGG